MKTIFPFLLILTVNIISAQAITHNGKIKYFGLHQVGLQAGSSSEKMSVLTTNGIHKGNWYGGVSTGIDWYGIRSIPLLASVHKAFGQSRHQPFIYANAGVEFAWMEDYDVGFRFGSHKSDFRNGLSTEAGLGYFINLKNKTALSLSAGFSYKQMGIKETITQVGVEPLFDTNVYDYKFHYRRIAIKLGLKI